MGEDPRTASPAVTGSSDAAVTRSSNAAVTSSDPAEIRREIEATREELGDTVAALAAKADIKSQAKQKLQETKATLMGKRDAAMGKRNELMGKAKQASPQTASTAATSVTQKARENPVPTAAAGAFAFGFLAGWVMRR